MAIPLKRHWAISAASVMSAVEVFNRLTIPVVQATGSTSDGGQA